MRARSLYKTTFNYNKIRTCIQIIILSAALIAALFLTGCERETNYGITKTPEKTTLEIHAFNTYMTVTAYNEELSWSNFFKKRVSFRKKDASEMAALINEIEAEISITVPDSDIYNANERSSNETIIGSRTAEMVQSAIEMSKITDGAFDITSYPLKNAWGFTSQTYRIPSESELKALISCVGYHKMGLIRYETGSSEGANSEKEITANSKWILSLDEGVKLDLGGIAKGYLGDVLTGVLREKGITSANLSLGGNVSLIGRKPNGELWKIGITDPENNSLMIGHVEVEDTNVVTSGGYERYFIGEDGKTYWHIMDPKTGYPAKSGVISSTIICRDGAMADALSTALFVMGSEKAEALYRRMKEINPVINNEVQNPNTTAVDEESQTKKPNPTVADAENQAKTPNTTAVDEESQTSGLATGSAAQSFEPFEYLLVMETGELIMSEGFEKCFNLYETDRSIRTVK